MMMLFIVLSERNGARLRSRAHHGGARERLARRRQVLAAGSRQLRYLSFFDYLESRRGTSAREGALPTERCCGGRIIVALGRRP